MYECAWYVCVMQKWRSEGNLWGSLSPSTFLSLGSGDRTQITLHDKRLCWLNHLAGLLWVFDADFNLLHWVVCSFSLCFVLLQLGWLFFKLFFLLILAPYIQYICRYSLELFSCGTHILGSHIQPWADCTHFFLLTHFDYLPCHLSLPFIVTGCTIRVHFASEHWILETEFTSQMGFKFTWLVGTRYTKL